ncbi:single-stranded DNA-binding protein [Pasteurella multocida]|nr:single-stranded DNA-binding protein [Pasteurella multocida]MDY0485035.1 single-stranded DNA-binding protein [Pasteurella multocida]MDY0534384.1 single-stranded DNA-binding protein [Pasteurella multocida]MDY0537130.1 single-stranded DNA-binding protein [Pasteurella multocida]MDY0555070.1 single-stranded DNA-binding protein [Pasteurella multocida]
MMRTGFYIVGKLLGQKSTNFTNRETGELKEKHTLGVQLQEPDGFGGYNTLTQELKIDERSVNQGLTSTVERLKGKLVMILVFPREWAMEGGRKGITYNFDENSSIEEVK